MTTPDPPTPEEADLPARGPRADVPDQGLPGTAPSEADGPPSGAKAAPEPDLLDGRYRLEEIVGEGGMAQVWRAQDTVLGRVVAVKILRSQYAADPEFLARFQSEARAAAGLNHPGIVSVFDVGRAGDRHYLVMEYIPGDDLKTRLRADPPLTIEETIRIAATVARAVGQAHDAGLVHRDLKPQNVLLARDGRVKVTDFGIARAMADTGITAPGMVLGTVHYLAPEQAAGGAASPASDVYSMGVVLYEMLTGRVPHEADSSVGVAMKIAHEDPEPVDDVNPAVPPVLAGIVAKAMARSVADRYADGNELADALDGFARWSEQTTGAMRPVAKSAVAGTADGGTLGAPPARPAPPRGRSPVADGPLIDTGGLVLALAALLAVAGLIPLWTAVLTRVDPGAVRSAFGMSAPTAVPVPTATPTPEPEQLGEAVIPDLRNLTEEEATQRLRDLDLGLTVETRESVTTTAGIVMSQMPPPGGDPVPPGTVVGLVISGEPLVDVPAAAGDFESVANTILALGLEPVRRDRWGGASSAVGNVLSIDPPPGSRLPRGSPVDVTVNSGSWLPLGVDFDDFVHLSGVDLPTNTVAPGGVLSLAARWEATGNVTGTYRMVAQLLGPAGPVSRDAHQPLGGTRPTNTWHAGEVVYGDAFNLPVPADLAPGDYTLVVGVESDDEAGTPLALIGRGPGVRVSDNNAVVITVTVAGS